MQHSTKKLGMMFTAGGWLLGLILLGVFFSKILGNLDNPNQTIHSTQSSDYKEVILTRNRHGHYVFNGEINQQSVTFLVDTGATTTAIPQELQLQLDLNLGPSFEISTANGNATAYHTELEQLSIGDIQLLDVRASILPGMLGEEALLGMNVLKHFELIQRGDQLIIRQYR